MASSSIPSHRKPPRRKSNPNPNSTIKPTSSSSSSSSSSSWCCSFKSPPKSPETLISLAYKYRPNYNKPSNPTSETLAKSVISSVSSSPMSAKSGLSLVGRIDPRKILSPGRVSPIDDPIPYCQVNDNVGPTDDEVEVEVDVDVVGPMKEVILEGEVEVECEYDVRLSLKGKNGGGCLVLEVNSRVLKENSVVFDGLINGNDFSNGGKNGGFWRIEVPDVEDLGVFRETIELMFEEDVARKLIKIGPYRAIDILEVSASIKFNRGVQSCLKYLEAVPWTEEDEEKLSKLFTKFKFDDASSTELFSRLNLNDCNTPQQNLASQLIRSITACENIKPRNELKSMVKGLLSKSSVYEKDHHDITKDDLYSVCRSCLSSLVTLFQDDSNKKNLNKPLIESVSWQVENINWLLEILLDRHMAEDFVDVWAAQTNLLDLHKRASPMVRYELSRISAVLFTAMGTRKLQCGPESRSGFLRSWFGPMLLDFGWLQRCRKGLNVRELEEAMGQTLLTLPLKQQYSLFMEWFRCFSKRGTECPNLSKAFQVWWRRSFLRGSETRAIESR